MERTGVYYSPVKILIWELHQKKRNVPVCQSTLTQKSLETQTSIFVFVMFISELYSTKKLIVHNCQETRQKGDLQSEWQVDILICLVGCCFHPIFTIFLAYFWMKVLLMEHLTCQIKTNRTCKKYVEQKKSGKKEIVDEMINNSSTSFHLPMVRKL